MRKTLVLGASTNPARYSYMAIQRLRQHGHEVFAIGRDEGKVSDVPILKSIPNSIEIDTVTMYLNPDRQKEYYSQILGLHPKRIIFNPGSENNEFASLAKNNGIQVMEACTLVLLATGQF